MMTGATKLSAGIRDRIHRENVMLYATLKHIGGCEAANVQDEGLPAVDVESKAENHSVVDRFSADDMLNACIRDRIHKENMMSYANIKYTYRREAVSVLDTALQAADVETTSEDRPVLNRFSAKKCSVKDDSMFSTLNALISDRIHKENVMSYANVKPMYRREAKDAQDNAVPGAAVETKLEDNSGLDFLPTKKFDGDADHKLSILNACIRDRIHEENMMSYAKLKNTYERVANNLQDPACSAAVAKTKLEDISGSDRFSTERIDDRADGKLSMLSKCVRDLIHRENMMMYASLRDTHGHEVANLQETVCASADTKPQYHWLLDGSSAKKADDKVDKQLRMLIARIWDSIYRETLMSYANLRDTYESANFKDAELRAEAVELKLEDYCGFARQLSGNSQLSTEASEDESERIRA